MKLDEEDGAKETETEAEPEQATEKETAEKPENKSVEIHGLNKTVNQTIRKYLLDKRFSGGFSSAKSPIS